LTFFRQALIPTAAAINLSPQSRWRGKIYSAHFTISDIAQQRFYPYERFSRGKVSGGAEVNPYHVWLEDWSATEITPAVRLQAQTSGSYLICWAQACTAITA